jgi:PKD repeat protein
MKNSFFTLVLLMSSVLGAFAQCTASYSATQVQNNVVSFTNTSLPVNSTTFFWWNYGDNTPPEFAQSPTHTFGAPGTYTVCLSMFDSVSQCQQVFCDTVTVTGTVLCNLSFALINVGNETCTNCNDGSIVPTLTGGTFPFTYQWSNGDTTPSISGLSPGVYTVCVTDANGCVVCDSATVNAMSLCTVAITNMVVTNESCIGCSDGSIVSTVSGGLPPYSYTWSNAATTTSVSGLSAGYYTLCVTDANNCLTCDTVIVQGPASSSCQAAFTANPLSNTLYQFINTSVVSQFGNYIWDFGDGQYAYTQNPTHSYIYSGNYTVCLTVYDSVYSCVSVFCDTLFNVIGTGGPAACNASFYTVYDTIQSTQMAWVVNQSTASSSALQIWNWGDNTSDTAAFPTHVYSQTGTYTICLYIIDTVYNCTDTMCQTINVFRLTQQAASVPFTVNVVPSVPTNISEIRVEEWSVYPVPSTDVLNIRSSQTLTGYQYSVIDLSGRAVDTGVLSSAQLNIQALDKGIYILQLVNESGAASVQRFIKQ